MYWYYKLIFSLFGLLILVGLGYALRGCLPERTKAPPPAVPEQVQHDPAGSTAMTPTVARVTPPPTNPQDPAVIALQQKIAIAQKHLQSNEPELARVVLETVLKDPAAPPYSEIWVKAARVISEANTVLLMSTAPCPPKVTYIVQKGDSIWKIAQDHKMNQEMVVRGNQLDPTDARIFPNQTLRLYQANWNLVVSKTHYLLLLCDGERLVKLYDIGIGKQDRTPVGTFKIVTRKRDPDYPVGGKVYRAGDPENILGTRWLGLEPTGTTDRTFVGYGIHGTSQPMSIGDRQSNGCIRLRNADVEELHDIVPLQTPVTIAD